MSTTAQNTNISQEDLNSLVERNKALEATYKLFEIVSASLDFQQMSQKIADIIPQTLGYETGVLALIDESTHELVRTAISDTTGGVAAVKNLEVPFNRIRTPMDHEQNICIKVIKEKKQMITHDLYDVLRPAISKENAELVKKQMGVTTSIVNPLLAHDKPIGVLIASMSKNPENLGPFEKEMISKFSQTVGIVLEHSRLYTDLKKAQIDLDKAYKALRQLDRAKDDFLSVASHELRTPMTIIKSYIWMLQSGKYGELNEDQKRYSDIAMRGTERLINLVNDMLNISRIEQGRMDFDIKKWDLCEVLKETIEGLKMRAEQQNIYLKIKQNCKHSEAYFDQAKIKEIIINLVGNALKFTKQGGITLQLDDLDDFVKISVIDTGVGIKKEDQKALYKKFGRLDNSYTKVAESGGTGLGLHIVKLYTERMGGRVGIYSEGEYKGSTFWFTLPKKDRTSLSEIKGHKNQNRKSRSTKEKKKSDNKKSKTKEKVTSLAS